MRKKLILGTTFALAILGCGDGGGSSGPIGPDGHIHPMYGTWEKRLDTTHAKGKEAYEWAVAFGGRYVPDTLILNPDSIPRHGTKPIDKEERFSFDRDSIYFWDNFVGREVSIIAQEYHLIGERMDTLEIGPDSITVFSFYVRIKPGD